MSGSGIQTRTKSLSSMYAGMIIIALLNWEYLKDRFFYMIYECFAAIYNTKHDKPENVWGSLIMTTIK